MNPRAIVKLSNFLNSRNKLFQHKLLRESVGSCFKLNSSAAAGISTSRQSYGADGKISGRIFADYAIFKGKAALSAAPVLPTFSKLEIPNAVLVDKLEQILGCNHSGHTKVERRGTIMLTFRPAIGERKYDSEKKQLFALSVTEIGSFISLGPQDSCEFFHDPSMKSRDAGQVRKSLSIKPITDGYFISLSVTNNILNRTDRFTVPVTTAEFAVMRAAFSYALPHIMGWAHSTNQLSDNVGRDSSKAHPQLAAAAASEWDR